MTLLEDAHEFFGTDALQDPNPLYDRMRDRASVHRNIGESTFYAVCGWDAVMEAVSRVEDFSSNLTATMVYHDDGTVTPFDRGLWVGRNTRWPPPMTRCTTRTGSCWCPTCPPGEYVSSKSSPKATAIPTVVRSVWSKVRSSG